MNCSFKILPVIRLFISQTRSFLSKRTLRSLHRRWLSCFTLDNAGNAKFSGNVTQELTTGDAGLTVKTNGTNQSAYITIVGQNAGDSDISKVSEGAGLGAGFSIRRGGFTGPELFNIERASGNATFNGGIVTNAAQLKTTTSGTNFGLEVESRAVPLA